ncbi:hypothetical protein GKZ68_16150 [Hymenobacter sp. BRD128]|nr:hypothetical protein [Hymenobacter sp. BRD128]QKG58015.1 hypothetical protein GKZ68_16150 [Hymenobacter sp. BRD128]
MPPKFSFYARLSVRVATAGPASGAAGLFQLLAHGFHALVNARRRGS